MKLYEISGQFRGLELLSEDPDCPLDAETLADTMSGIKCEFEDKAIAVLAHMGNIGSDIKAIDDAIDRLKAKKTTLVNTHEWFREYIRGNMEASNFNKIESPIFNATLRKATQMVEIKPGFSVHEEWMLPEKPRPDLQPDKKKILRDLKAGIDVPGCKLIDGKRGLLIK